MNFLVRNMLTAACLLVIGSNSARSQTVIPTPFFTAFFDSVSTFNGKLMPVGTIIEAFDIDGILNGRDTVTIPGFLRFMPVYGDDSNSGVDKGALEGELIRFTINGRDATVTAGDPTWSNNAIKQVSLEASSTSIAMSAVDLPVATASVPGDTIQFRVRVRNDGDGLDFYGVNLSMSIPEDTSFGWVAFEPDSFVYAAAGTEADVFFSIRAAIFTPDTVNTISYSVFSHLDTTVTVDATVDIFLVLTDVEDDPTGSLPGSFVLHQNYPNPFNPSTTISYELPRGSAVQFQVYDILGRAVENSDLGFLPAGIHDFIYDASLLPSGVYFYRIISAVGSANRKMLLVK